MGAFTYGLANFFILAGWVLLLVATISAPVIDHIAFLKVQNGNTAATFGALGYCQSESSGSCTKAALGYPLSQVAGAFGGDSSYVNTSVDRATKALILHPIAAGIAFIAQIIGLSSVQFGFLFASLVVFLAFIVSLAAMALDFALFGIVRNAINRNSTNVLNIRGGSGPAMYSTATWLVLAATISLLIASIFTLFACCCGGDRRERRSWRNNNKTTGYGESGYVGNQQPVQTGYAPTRAHWWSRRNKY